MADDGTARDEDVDLGGGAPEDVAAVIESAKARGDVDTLRDYIAKTLSGAEDGDPQKVADVASVALEIIETIPILLASAHREAEDRGLAKVVLPLLERAERYFLVPIDLIPEMTHGLPGLLDDAYLVLRTLENLESGPEPFLDWDLDVSLEFLQGLLGRSIAGRLDEIAADAVTDLQDDLQAAWNRTAHRA
ncbi:MAG: DUF1232 domain-containing protein [Gemmatimonadota bacterium]